LNGRSGPCTWEQGRIVLNSIDADGTKKGFDLEITRRVSESVHVPVVASGGAGTLEHMAEVLLTGRADAVLAASIFHFGEFTVAQVKNYLASRDIPVRMLWNWVLQNRWLPILLLFFSNIFMTFAWYGHLKHKDAPC
jgi:hypothetical protein